MNVKIYIEVGTDWTELDLYDGINISLEYAIADIRDPESRDSSFSKTITIPGSKINNRVFDYIFEIKRSIQNSGVINFTPDFNPNLRANARITIDEMDVFSGTLQLLKINVIRKDDISYEVTVISSPGSLFEDIGDAELTDLDLSEYDHPLTRLGQQNTSDQEIVKNGAPYVNFAGLPFGGFVNGEPTGEGYVYPLIDYGYSPDGQEFGVEDLFPAVYVKEYIDKIFASVGYTYNSAFFNSAFFKKLIIPFNGVKDQAKIDDTEVTARQFSADRLASTQTMLKTLNGAGIHTENAIFNNDVFLGMFDPSNVYNDLTGIWTVPVGQAGRYNVETTIGMAVRIPVPDANIPVGDLPFYINESKLVMKLNAHIRMTVETTTGIKNVVAEGTFLFEHQSTLMFASTITTAVQNINLKANNIALEEGDQIYIEFEWYTRPVSQDRYIAFFIDGFGDRYTEDIEYTDLLELRMQAGSVYFNKSLAVGGIAEGNVQPMNNFIPANIKQKDLLTSLIKRFNLYVEQDKTVEKQVKIEPREDYFIGSVIKDWTAKVDQASETEIIPMGELEARRYLFKDKEDKDFWNETYTERWKEVYGQHEEVINNDFVPDVKLIDTIFSPTVVAQEGLRKVIIPKLYGVKEDKETGGERPEPISTNIRLLHFSGNLPSHPWVHSSKYSNPQARNTVPFAGHQDDYDAPTVDLNWGSPNEIYYRSTAYTDNNVYNKYWKKFIDQITDKNSKIVVAMLYLTPSDIQGFKFSDTIFIDGNYYFVNKIMNYNPVEQGLTKVELLFLTSLPDFIATAVTISNFLNPIQQRGVVIEGGRNQVVDAFATAPYNILEGGLDEVRAVGALIDINLVDGGFNSI